jgi:hypothetical protein
MSKLGLIAFIFFVSSQCKASIFDSTDLILEICPDSYKEQLIESPGSNSPDWLILCYSPLCGHCLRFAPFYMELAARFQGYAGLRFGAVNVIEPSNRPIVAAENIRAVPVLEHYRITLQEDGRLTRQKTILPRDIGGLVNYIDGLYPLVGEYEGSFTEGDVANAPRQQRVISDPRSFVEDAETALSLLLNFEVFRGNMTLLSPQTTKHLTNLLSVCEGTFPNLKVAQACKEIRHAVINVASEHVGLSRDTWESVLGSSPLAKSSDSKLKSCTSLTCALWRVLHVFSIGLGGKPRTLISAVDAMTSIRAIMDEFSSCAECRSHFLQHYDRCDFGRCDSSEPTWEKTAIWLWRFHNAVTLRVHRGRDPWPPSRECPKCFHDDGSAYEFLVSSYSLVPVNQPLRMDEKSFSQSLSLGAGLTIIILIVSFI